MNCPKTLICPKQPPDSLINFKNIPEKKICRRCEKGKDKVIKKSKYKRLKIGQIVKKGDEYWASDQLKWCKCSKQSIGRKIMNDYDALIDGHPYMSLEFRRPMKGI